MVLALSFFVATSPLYLWRRLRGGPYPFVVLMYHAVKDHEKGLFKRQMDTLIKWAKPVRADFEARGHSSGPFVAVTFDDGYTSVMRNAVPELQSRKIPATIFVVTAYLGGPPGWVQNPRHRNFTEKVMDLEQLRELKRTGITIGSHTVNHKPLARLHADETLQELEESKAFLEEHFAEPVTMFSVPYGLYDEQVLQLSAKAGYQRVFLSEPLTTVSNVADHIVGRIGVEPTDWMVEFWLKLNGAYCWLPHAIEAKSRIKRLLTQRKREPVLS